LFEYIIRPGDTLYNISLMYNVPISAILSLNPGLNPYNLIVNEVILIPYSNYPTQPVYPVYPLPSRRAPGRGFMPGSSGSRR
jgi:LysM repeat protein